MARLRSSVLSSILLSLTLSSLTGAVITPTLDVKVDRNPSYKPNGPAAYAQALRKWGAPVPVELEKALAVMGTPPGNGGTGDIAVDSVLQDREYLSRVGVGTPPQWLWLDLDTGSADLWMYTSETREATPSNRTVFKIEESTTAQRIENGSWSIAYGDGSSAYGTLYHDTVTLGPNSSLIVLNSTIESALSTSASLSSDPILGGILGLSCSLNSNASPKQPAFLSVLLSQLGEPVFTVDLKHYSSEFEGEGAYTFGYTDKGRVLEGTDIWYTPLFDASKFWEVSYTGMHVGGEQEGHRIGGDGRETGSPSESNSSSESDPDSDDEEGSDSEPDPPRAIIDTGTTLILVTPDKVKAYYDAVPGAQKGAFGGLWTFPCQLNSTSPSGEGEHHAGGEGWNMTADMHGKGTGDGGGQLPPLIITFPPNEISSTPFIAKIPGAYLNYSTMWNDPESCMGGLQEWPSDDFGIFGAVFLKTVYAVFDVGQGRVGFAPKDLGESGMW
ncbi:aspartic peptidase domain-containing protein [Chaetomium sp. MPI-SDFR-AT-0129]|nr:aspartic peptidase domain-containing protein [Chaetomium sp. MPI-SDFR-AT-0129]